MRGSVKKALANANRFPLTVKTETYPPLAKFSARFGIIETSSPLLPVTVRNIEAELMNHMLAVEGESEEILPEPPETSGGRSGRTESAEKTPTITQQVKGKV